jgi:hypothetical protein
VIIAPFFADVYTSTWPISGLVTYGADTVNGHAAFGINYFRVNYYAASDKMNTFQLLLINRSDRAPGDFDIQFNYGNIAWETGSASGGTDGLGGSSARAGFSNGTGQPNTFFELPGSAINGGLLDTNAQTGLINSSLNSSIPGVYVFNAHAGAVVPPGFALSTTSLTFPTTAVNQPSSPMPVTVSNTGGSTFAISNIATSAGFSQTGNCLTTLVPGATCTANVVFTPTATGAQTGTLTFTDSAPGSPHTVTLNGTGTGSAQATLSAPSLTFSSQNVGTTSAPQTLTLTNTGSGPLTITSIAPSGDFAQTNNCGATVAAGTSCILSITFTPTATGARSGSVTLTDNASPATQTITLTGTGVVPAVTLSGTSLTFAVQAIGTTSPIQTATLTNSGSGTVNIASITPSGDFAVTNNCGGTVAAGANCTLSVTFTPTAAGARTGSITVVDNASTSPQTVSLSGTGTSPAQLTLSATSLTLPGTHINQTCTPGTVTLTNTGTAALTISNISITSGPYTETNNCPATLAAGANCSVSVTFVPVVVGTAEAGTLTITSNAASSPDTVALTANGLPACFLAANFPAAAILLGSESTTFSIAHQACSAAGPVHLSCSNQGPATCAFSPDTLTSPDMASTLTMSNLQALTSDLNFQVHADAALEHLNTGLSVNVMDFLVVSTPITGTITAGQTASYAMAVAPQNGLQGTVSFSCTGAPIGATCAVAPATVTLSGPAPSNVTVTVTTTARSLVAPRDTWRVLPPGSSPMGLMLLAMLALLAGLAYCAAGRSPLWQGAAIGRLLCSAGLRPAIGRSESGATTRLRLASLGLGLMLAVVLTWTACGGGSPVPPMSQNAVATPAGTYNLTVTGTYSAAGTSAQIVHNTTLTLTVH